VSKISSPTISVLLPVRNAAYFIDEAMESILGQSEPDLEVVAINDGSTDDTAERLKAWTSRDDRCRVFHSNGLGPAGALNVALLHAQGSLLARMDADDISLPGRLASQRALFEKKPRLVVCGTWARTFGDAGSHTWRHPINDGAIRARLIFDSPLVHPSVMLRRCALASLQPLYRSEFGRAEDYDLWERLQHLGEMENIPQVLLRYRTHPAQVTVTARSDSEAGAAKVRRRILQVWWPESTVDEQNWHHSFCANLLSPTRETLDAAERWLQRLSKHHKRDRIATEREWRSVIAMKWWEACRHCRILGPIVLQRFIRSSLPGKTSVPAKRILRLVVETMSSRQKKVTS